ncbi:MAG: glycosyltransferase family 4 protein [Candidatus Eisenbacteria bacterium]|uniref:Glycosyltransferase family 4 protein n=1 Tax=Eiseniibacteriota bacterium TaxID=2212470 RepID=A0A937XA98_UNCEI|nr:glycosyltransferase family 4 protein [Candidatus Eisenbacteria bacterium]
MPGQRERVLLVGPLRGATGGVAMFTETLLASRLGGRFEFVHLDTTRTAAGSGRAATLAPINFLYFVRQWLELARLLARHRPRILHQPVTSGISFWKEAAFMACGRLAGARVVAHLHGARFQDFHGGGGSVRRWLVRRALRCARVVIVLSDGWRRYLLERVDGRLRAEIVANPVARDFVAWASGVERDPGRAPATVLFVGRLARIKGLVTALQAVPLVQRRAPGTRFVFAGGPASAAENAEVERARASLPADGTVLFPGLIGGPDKRSWFQGADVLILPSTHENLPIVILEGLAAGLPLVVTPVGALPEFLVEGEHALFVPPGDAGALAGRVADLIADPSLRRRMGEANRALFRERFDPDRILERIEQIYREALS